MRLPDSLSPGATPEVMATLVYMITHRPLPLRGYLVNQGVSVDEFAQRIGISRQHTSAVLNRKAPLSHAFAVAAAQELGLGLAEVAVLLGPPESWGQGRWPTAD